MSQVLGGQFCLIRPSFDFQFEFFEAASEGCSGSGKLTECGGHGGAEDACIGAGEEPARAQAKAGQAVSVTTGNALDDAVEPKATELVGVVNTLNNDLVRGILVYGHRTPYQAPQCNA